MSDASSYPSVFSFISRPDGCSWWRVASPFNALQRRGYPARYGWFNDQGAQRIAHEFNIVMFPRLGWQSVLRPGAPSGSTFQSGREMLAIMHQLGQLAMTDVDDDIWHARREQKSHVELGLGHVPEASPEENIASLGLYDGLTVSEERLRTIAESECPDVPVEVVPNAIDLEYWEACLASGWRSHDRADRSLDRLDGKTVIGWAGGNRQDRDFDVLAEAWRRVARRYSDVMFVTMGHQATALAEAIPDDRLLHVDWLDIQPSDDSPPYPVGLALFDISCCSVFENRFNHAKSPIKAYESAAAGAAVVASPWVYDRVIEHGRNGLLASSVGEWERALGKLVRSKGTRRRLSRALLRDVKRKHSLAACLDNWPNAWARLAEAGRARLERRYSVLVPGRVW